MAATSEISRHLPYILQARLRWPRHSGRQNIATVIRDIVMTKGRCCRYSIFRSVSEKCQKWEIKCQTTDDSFFNARPLLRWLLLCRLRIFFMPQPLRRFNGNTCLERACMAMIHSATSCLKLPRPGHRLSIFGLRFTVTNANSSMKLANQNSPNSSKSMT